MTLLRAAVGVMGLVVALGVQGQRVDVHKLPLGDGRVSDHAQAGYVVDGFGIYSMFDAHGGELTDADLDECHGRTSEVDWDGKRVAMYHYVLTREYPYTLGCFRGTPVAVPRQGPPRGRGFGPPPGGMGPPPE